MVKFRTYPVLTMKANAQELLLKYCRTETAREVCGVLAGRAGFVTNFMPVKNIAENANLYTMDPIEFSNTLDKLTNNNLELLALFHSHLGGECALSQIDIDNYTLNVPMVLVTPTDIKAFSVDIHDKHVTELTLIMAVVEDVKEPLEDGIVIKVSPRAVQEISALIIGLLDAQTRRSESRARQEMNIQHQQLIDDEAQMRRAIGHGNIGLPQMSTNTQAAIAGGISAVTEAVGEANRRIHTEIKSPVVPPHAHKYKPASKTQDGSNLYECTVTNCNATVLINGELEPAERRKLRRLAQTK